MANGIIPTKKQDGLQWIADHVAQWEQTYAQIGVSQQQVASLKTALIKGQDDMLNQNSAIDTARSATLKSNSSFQDARSLAQENLDRIRVFARASTNPNDVYAAANVPPPAAPTTQVPGTPTNFKATLNTSGSLKITWRTINPSQNPAGCVWVVKRAIGGGEAVQVGIVGGKSFTDATIPAGASQVTYTVQGQRGQTIGPVSNGFEVRFGNGGGNFAIVSQTMKAAA